MLRKFFVFAACILQLSFNATAEVAPVMLYAAKSQQHDTLGYNVVNDISGAVYNAVLSGAAKLWDSEQKSLQIQPSTLQKIERSSGAPFTGCEHLFIYELWTLEKKLAASEIIGFYFSSLDTKGQTVAFGYVDAKELTDALGTYVKLNENGNEQVTLLRVLRCKLYNYSIVQYKGKKVEGAEESAALKKEKAEHLLKFVQCPALKEVKTIGYSIVLYDSLAEKESGTKANLLLETIEDYFIDNRETLLNLGGAAALEFKVNKQFKVTAMRVLEVWTKEADYINMEPQVITLYINSRPINAMSVSELLSLGIIYDFKTLYDVLKEKDFAFRIQQINGNEVQVGNCISYLNALRKYKWNGLTEYVKYDQ